MGCSSHFKVPLPFWRLTSLISATLTHLLVSLLGRFPCWPCLPYPLVHLPRQPFAVLREHLCVDVTANSAAEASLHAAPCWIPIFLWRWFNIFNEGMLTRCLGLGWDCTDLIRWQLNSHLMNKGLHSITSKMLHISAGQVSPFRLLLRLTQVAMMQMPTTLVIKQIITLWEDWLLRGIMKQDSLFREEIEHREMINGSNREEGCLEWD